MNGTTVLLTAIGYVSFLFLIAWWGDGAGRRFLSGRSRPFVYALSLAVYCTSWTYYGSVGLASQHGLDFLPIYIGPILVIGLGAPFIARIANLARAQNVTTVADFVSARYGKSQAVAAVAALIALIGIGALCGAPAQGGRADRPDGGRIRSIADAHAGRALDFVLSRRVVAARPLRDGLRHPAHQPQGASGRSHSRHRGRIDRQTDRVSRRRRLRRLEAQQRDRRSDRDRRVRSEDRLGDPDASRSRGMGRDDAVVGVRDRASAAPVSRRGGRESRSARHPHRGLAVSGLSGADQSVRCAARHRRPQDFPGRVVQSRPDGSCAAAQRRRTWRGAPDDGGRPLGGDRNGGGRKHRSRDHHFQRPGDAAPAPASRSAGARRRRRHRRAGACGCAGSPSSAFWRWASPTSA